MGKIVNLKSVKEADYLSVSETSELLGVKESALRNYLNKEWFTTYKFKGLTLLSRVEVENWNARKKK